MKKIFVLLAFAIVVFVVCDYASESVELKPDIEIPYMNPMGDITWIGDTTPYSEILEIHFIAENSVDCYLDRMIFEYYDADGNLFHGPTEIPLYMKIPGIVDPAEVDTHKLLNVPLPLSPIWNNVPPGEAARALLHFVAIDEYFGGENADTCTVWFGIYMLP